jgi:hypothetical protein
MGLLGIILLLIIIYIGYRYYKYYYEGFLSPSVIKSRTNRERFDEKKKIAQIFKQKDWGKELLETQITPELKARHQRDMVNVTPIFGSGAGYSQVADDNNNPAFTNWIGLSRPSYVPILPGARTIPDIDIDVMKRMNSVSWVPKSTLD